MVKSLANWVVFTFILIFGCLIAFTNLNIVTETTMLLLLVLLMVQQIDIAVMERSKSKKVKKQKRKKVNFEAPLVSVKYVSDKYKIHPNTIRRWIHMGLRYTRRGRGGKILVHEDDIGSFIRNRYGEEEYEKHCCSSD